VEDVVLTVAVEDSALALLILTGFVPKTTLMPEGKVVVTLSVTLPVYPPEGVTVTVLGPEDPAVTVTLEAESEKLCGGGVLLPKPVKPRTLPMPLAKSQQPVAE
jgi:hypothetical protein